LRLRGSALRRLCELPAVFKLRDKWIAQSRKGDAEQRRYAVEQMGLLRDAATIPALEKALLDPVGAVEAAAVRGLLQLPTYQKRDELLLSLAGRSYLVRVLTACESADEASGVRERELEVGSLLALACAAGPVEELAKEEAAARASCLALAAQGATGFDSLRRMSAAGEAGDAPAEAFGASLAAAARGGRT
jgi:HEAT repeat protein